MSEELSFLYIWLLGWLIVSISYYIYKVYIDKDDTVTKKVHAWCSIWIGIWSWIAIFFTSVFFIVGGILLFNDWVKEKLNK